MTGHSLILPTDLALSPEPGLSQYLTRGQMRPKCADDVCYWSCIDWSDDLAAHICSEIRIHRLPLALAMGLEIASSLTRLTGYGGMTCVGWPNAAVPEELNTNKPTLVYEPMGIHGVPPCFLVPKSNDNN